MPGKEGALLCSASSVVTDVALAWTHLPFAGARSWLNPGCSEWGIEPWNGTGLGTTCSPGAGKLWKPSGSPAVPKGCAASGVLPDGLVQPHVDATFGCGRGWKQPAPPWVSCSSPGAGDTGLFPTRSRYLTVWGCAGTGCPRA